MSTEPGRSVVYENTLNQVVLQVTVGDKDDQSSIRAEFLTAEGQLLVMSLGLFATVGALAVLFDKAVQAASEGATNDSGQVRLPGEGDRSSGPDAPGR